MSAHLSCDLFCDKGKNPEDVVRRYTEKIKVLPDEVRKKDAQKCAQTADFFKSFVPTKRASESVINTQSCTVQWQMKRFGWLFQDCTICMERLVMSSGYEGILQHKGIKPELVGKLGKCGHMYHLLCLVAMYNNGNKVGKSL